MTEVVHEGVLSYEYPKTWGEVEIGIAAPLSTQIVRLLVKLPCGGGFRNIDVNLNEVVDIICSEYHPYYWTVEYTEYFSPYAARVKLCKELSGDEPEPDPEPSRWDDLVALILTPITLLIDGVRGVIDTGVQLLTEGLTAIAARIDMVFAHITDEVEELKVHIFGEIGGVKDKIDALGIPSIEDIRSELTTLINKIDNIEFPTVESIKECFLSVTTEFAESIWDKILDKIEERYNK